MRGGRPKLVVLGMLCLLLPGWAWGAPVVYTSQADYFSALSALTYELDRRVTESFDSDVPWAGTRIDPYATSVTSQGIRWESNYAGGLIQTTPGAHVSPGYGVHSSIHPTLNDPNYSGTAKLYHGFRGTVVQGLMIGVGGYFIGGGGAGGSASLQGLLYPGSGGAPTPIDFGAEGTLSSVAKFLGVIEALGFQAFEFRDTDGDFLDMKLVFGDDIVIAGDFTRDTVGPPPDNGAAVPEPSTWLLAGIGALVAGARRRIR